MMFQFPTQFKSIARLSFSWLHNWTFYAGIEQTFKLCEVLHDKRVSMGLTVNRQKVKKVTVNREKWKILTVNRQLNQA